MTIKGVARTERTPPVQERPPSADASLKILQLKDLNDNDAKFYIDKIVDLILRNTLPLQEQYTQAQKEKGFLTRVSDNVNEEGFTGEHIRQFLEYSRIEASGLTTILLTDKNGELIGCKTSAMPFQIAKSFAPYYTTAVDNLIKLKEFPAKLGISPTEENIWFSGLDLIDEKYRGRGYIRKLHKAQMEILQKAGCKYFVSSHDTENKASEIAMDKADFSNEYKTNKNFITKCQKRPVVIRVLFVDDFLKR